MLAMRILPPEGPARGSTKLKGFNLESNKKVLSTRNTQAGLSSLDTIQWIANNSSERKTKSRLAIGTSEKGSANCGAKQCVTLSLKLQVTL